MFENVEYEWNLSDDNLTDVSDDDENFKVVVFFIFSFVCNEFLNFIYSMKLKVHIFMFICNKGKNVIFVVATLLFHFVCLLQNGMSTPEKRSRSRPVSLPGSGSPICQRSSEHRGYSDRDQRSVGEYRGGEHRSSSSRWARNQPPPPPASSKPICKYNNSKVLYFRFN